MSAPAAWAALLETQRARYAAAGTSPALAALRYRALEAVAGVLSHLEPEQVTPAALLEALEALGLDLYGWHRHRLAVADALPAGAALPAHRPWTPATGPRTAREGHLVPELTPGPEALEAGPGAGEGGKMAAITTVRHPRRVLAMIDPDDDHTPFPHAWLVALLGWEHDRPSIITWREGVPLTDGHPGVLLAVVHALGESSPLDVTAAELATAGEDADLTDAQRSELPAALASFTAWACPRGVLEGEPLPMPSTPSPLRLLRSEH